MPDGNAGEIEEVEIEKIDPFPDHPYKVKDDADMEELVKSIKAQGVISPCIVRKKKEGRFELIAGHRRMHACRILGITKLRCIVLDIAREDATVLMVESNFQRSSLLPSEKAFAYKMRLDAMRGRIHRMKINEKKGQNYNGAPAGEQIEKAEKLLQDSYGDIMASLDPRNKKRDIVSPVGTQINRSTDLISADTGDSKNQIYRYIRLTHLVPELLDLVDEGRIGMRPAVELSYLELKQKDVYECIRLQECTPTHAQTIRMRRMYDAGDLTKEAIIGIMMEEKPNQHDRIILDGEKLKGLFPKNLPEARRADYVRAAMEHYRRYLDRKAKGKER